MTDRRRLDVKLALGIFVAFALTMAFTWLLHDRLAERDVYALIDRAFENVESEIIDCVNERLVRQCMAVREILDEGHPDDVASLAELARKMHVTEISVADANGDVVRSSVPEYLAGPGRPAFNFTTAGGNAEDMMCLVNGPETEYCQPFRDNTANGAWRTAGPGCCSMPARLNARAQPFAYSSLISATACCCNEDSAIRISLEKLSKPETSILSAAFSASANFCASSSDAFSESV